LLGLKTAHRHMFEDIAWSTERVAAQTLERAREIGLEVHNLPTWYDIDDMDDLGRLYNELNGVDLSARRSYPPHYPAQTARLLNRLWQDSDFRRRVGNVLQADEARA
jgi:uncharacterized protein